MPQLRGNERGAHFSDQLLRGIGMITKPLTKLPIAAGRMAGPAGQLVRLGGGVTFRVLKTDGYRRPFFVYRFLMSNTAQLDRGFQSHCRVS